MLVYGTDLYNNGRRPTYKKCSCGAFRTTLQKRGLLALPRYSRLY